MSEALKAKDIYFNAVFKIHNKDLLILHRKYVFKRSLQHYLYADHSDGIESHFRHEENNIKLFTNCAFTKLIVTTMPGASFANISIPASIFFSLGSAITSYQNNCELSDGNDYLPMELQSEIFVSFLSLNALCHLIVSEAYNLMPHLCFCRVVRILNFFCITFQIGSCIIHNL